MTSRKELAMHIRTAWLLMLVLAVVAGPSVRAAEQPSPKLAEPADTLPPSPRSFEESVAAFVAGYYLSGDPRADDEIGRLYADTVDYFDNRTWSRVRVLADKRAYYSRWPKRAYRLLRETLVVTPTPGAAKVYDVRFEYEFDVSGPDKRSRGGGRTLLTLDLATDSGRITRETGTVLARW
jgi:hypothetical protein